MQNVKDVPILFIVFNRPDTTRRVFEAIAEAKPRRLFIAADGPRPHIAGEVENCAETRSILSSVDWECDVSTLFREENLGCKVAVSSAITWFFEQVEAGIILEDDCLPSSSFFPFCAELLERYAHDERIMMIFGDNFQDGIQRGNASYYFSRIFHIWGWATWRRAWELHDMEMGLVSDFREQNIIHDIFTDQNIALHWIEAFTCVRTGIINTWDYPWVYSCLVQHGLSIVPNVNLVSNIGFGSGGSHTTNADSKFSCMDRHEMGKVIHPDYVACNVDADIYEYIDNGVYPYQREMNRRYRRKRVKKARKDLEKIDTAYNQGNVCELRID